MSDIGVFHANEFNSTFFTQCCEVAICDNQESCPGCGKKVIPAKDRWKCATGSKHRAIQLAWREKYRASGAEQAGKVAARLEGKPYVLPNLCLMCGKPVAECYC
jgi:hypothetical protein